MATNGIIALNADEQEGENNNDQPSNDGEHTGQALPNELPATGTLVSKAALIAGTLGVTTYLMTIEIRKRNRDLYDKK
jgi:hypothetical protein